MQPKKDWGLLFVILFLVFISGSYFAMWIESKTLQYDDVAPTFEKLRVDQGLLLTFTERWKSRGGYAVIRIENGSVITLSCGGPACYTKKIDGKRHSLRSKLTRKMVTVWWDPYKYPYKNVDDAGRLFQLQMGDELIYVYADQLAKYSKQYKAGRPDALVLAIVWFLVAVILSIHGVIKRRK